MKNVIPFMLLWLCLLPWYNVNAQSGDVKWQHTYEEAAQLAATEHKPIVMVFAGSDWCKPCIMLRKEVWDTPEFHAYAKEHFVLLKLDFPRFKKNQLPAAQTAHNEQLAGKYNQEGIFPMVVLADEKGQVLAKTGYQPGGPASYIAHLEQILHHK